MFSSVKVLSSAHLDHQHGIFFAALDMDHRPSFAAQVKAAEKAKGGPLDKAELEKLKNDTPAEATPRKDHQQKSRTYGGRNSDERSTEDAADLEAAKAKDDAAYKK